MLIRNDFAIDQNKLIIKKKKLIYYDYRQLLITNNIPLDINNLLQFKKSYMR